MIPRPAMSSPMNTLLLGLTMYDTCLIVTSVLMVGIPSINNYHFIMINSHDSQEEPIFNIYMSSIFPFIMPVLYPVLTTYIFQSKWTSGVNPRSQNGPLGSTPEVKMDLWGQPHITK